MCIDTCNNCRIFTNHIQDAIDEEDDEMEQEYTEQFQEHMTEAAFGYQVNKAIVDWCRKRWRIILDLPEGTKIKLRLYRNFGKYQFGPIHITIDWDKDRNEFQGIFNKFYMAEKPQFTSLNIRMEPETVKGIIIFT